MDVSVPAVFVRTTSAAFPVGDAIVGARYGVHEDLELSLHLHPAALYVGILGFETGATWHPMGPDGAMPGLHVSSHVLVLTHLPSWGQAPADALRGVFELEVIAHWEPLPWLWPYVVLEDSIVLADGEPVASIIAGVQSWVTPRVALSLEAGLAGLGTRSEDLTATFVGVGGHGGVWVAMGLSYRFVPDRARPEVSP